VWGLIVGGIIAMIIGFALGGTTSGTTKTMTEKAVLASEFELDKIPFGRRFLAATRLELADKSCCGVFQYLIY
jgi:hypothetical protein